MLRVLFFVAQGAVLAHVIYHGAVAMWGWRSPALVAVGERRRRLRVVVPAHNEARVIGGVLSDLIDDPYDNRAVCVIADRCTDETAVIAKGHGAAVAERSEGASGKGAALVWYLEKHPLAAEETLVIFDADNRLPENTLGRIADRLDAGAEAVQCYLDVENPGESWLATASALSYWASNRMVQLARSALGWSVDLGGTGMALSAAAIEAAGGFGTSLTEDQEMAARLALAGVPVRWLHRVRIRDEKPTDVGAAVQASAVYLGLPAESIGRASEQTDGGRDRHDALPNPGGGTQIGPPVHRSSIRAYS